MRQSLEWLVSRYQRSLFAAVFNLCRNAEDANDIVQETFIQYLTTDTEFQDERHIHAWLLRVAINKTKNMFRSSWNRKVQLTEEDLSIKDSDTELHDLMNEIMTLPEKYRIVIHLYYYEEFSVKEISEILDISEGNVKMRLSRARSMLKKVLEEDAL